MHPDKEGLWNFALTATKSLRRVPEVADCRNAVTSYQLGAGAICTLSWVERVGHAVAKLGGR